MPLLCERISGTCSVVSRLALDPSIANLVPATTPNTAQTTPLLPNSAPAELPRATNNTPCQDHRHLAPLSSLRLLARYAPRAQPRSRSRSLDANTAQLADVTKAIKSIVDGDVETDLAPAYQKYNEEQYTTTKLPGGSTDVLVSPYNSLGDGRYYDTETQSSFDFDHATQKASAIQSYVVESQHEDLV